MKRWYLVLVATLPLYLAGCAGSRPTADYESLLARALPVEDELYADQAGLSIIDSNSSLDNLLAYAALNNPELKAAFYQWQADLQRIAQVTALPDPRISYAYFIREVETRVGPQRQRIGVSQTLPWFGKLGLSGDIATQGANAARARFDNRLFALQYTVKDAYYEYAYLQQAIGIFEENVQLLTYLKGVIEAKYRAGSAAYASLIKIEVELDKVKDRLRDLQDRNRPLRARLNAALDRPVDALLPLPAAISTADIQIADTMWVAWLLANNPDLQEDAWLVKKEQSAIDLARKNYFPDLSFGVDFIETGEALNPGMAESGKDPVIAMVSLNIPLWPGKNRASVNEAQARHHAAVNRLGNRRNQLFARLESVLYQFREAGRKIKLYDESLIPRSRQALEVTRSAFETGALDFLDLIDAQRTLLEFELLLVREKANYNQRLAELEMLAGKNAG